MTAENAVLVTEEDGTVLDIIPFAEAGEGVETLNGILSPGFINCHCHLELSHMKGMVPEKTGLVDFLLAVMGGRNNGSGDDPAETMAAAIAAAEESMLHCGIVAVGDICNTTNTLSQKAMGRLYYHNFIETMGFTEQGAAERFQQSCKIFEAFAEAYTLPIEANSLVPHAPYSVSPRLFELVANFPGNHVLTIHNQESEAENEFYRNGQGDFLRLYKAIGLDTHFFKGTGKRSLPSYLPHFYRNQSLILVHNVATTEEDLRLAGAWRESGTTTGPNLYFCLCPNANLYISGQLPDVDMLVRSGRPIVLGTDSLASNHQLDILQEAKALQARFPELTTATLLSWATANGAEALQLDGVLGSFTPGRQPGVVLIEGGEGEQLTAGARAVRLV